MKNGFLAMAIVLNVIYACNNDSTNHKDHAAAAPSETTTNENEKVATIQPTFASLEPGVASHINGIFDHYVHVKTALVNSNATEAKSGATAILGAIKNFDKSLLPANQKQAYDKSIGAIRTAAGDIAATNDIEKQREHFSRLVVVKPCTTNTAPWH
jgi:hypothetical protein